MSVILGERSYCFNHAIPKPEISAPVEWVEFNKRLEGLLTHVVPMSVVSNLVLHLVAEVTG